MKRRWLFSSPGTADDTYGKRFESTPRPFTASLTHSFPVSENQKIEEKSDYIAKKLLNNWLQEWELLLNNIKSDFKVIFF